MASFGDTSQYSALMANMLAQARNRPISPTGQKVLALGKTPISSNLTATQDQTTAGVNLGGILSLFGKHPAQKAIQTEQLRKDAEMAWIAYNVNLSPEQRDKLYSQPQIQDMFTKMQATGIPYVWDNPNTQRKEMLPMSPIMYAKVTGQKPLTKDEIATLSPTDPRRINAEQFYNSVRAKSEAEIAGSGLVQQKYQVGADLSRSRAGEADAATTLKTAEAGDIPSKADLRAKQGNLADAQAGWLEGQKGQPAKLTQEDKKLRQGTVSGIMKNFHKTFSDATKVDYRYGTEEFAQQLTNLNSATVGTLNQLKAYEAKPEMAGVVGSWITKINKELVTPPKKSGGIITPSELSRLNDIRGSINQVVIAAGVDKDGQPNLPMYQIETLNEMVIKLNTYLGTGTPK